MYVCIYSRKLRSPLAGTLFPSPLKVQEAELAWVADYIPRWLGFPSSLPSVGPEADSNVQAVSPQVTRRHLPGSRLPLLSARPAVAFPAADGIPTKRNSHHLSNNWAWLRVTMLICPVLLPLFHTAINM